MTQGQLATKVHLSQSQVSALERGEKGTIQDQAVLIDEVLNAGGALARRWEDAHAGVRGYAEWFAGVAAVEREATEIKEYQCLVVPGLLQTEWYAHAVIRQGRPDDTDQEISERVETRMERQAILSSERPPMLRVIIDEHVLRKPLGGYDVMREQLGKLVGVSNHPRVTVAVVPMDTDVNPGQDGPFMMFTVPERGSVTFTETRVSGHPSDDPPTVDVYARVFSELGVVALPPAPSRHLINHIKEELGS